MPWLEGEWSIFVYGNQRIGKTNIAPNYQSPKAAHKGKPKPKLDPISWTYTRKKQLISVTIQEIQTNGVISLLKKSWYCFYTFQYRLYCKISSSYLKKSSLVWWYALICSICVFSHSRKTLMSAQYLLFITRAHYLCRLVSKKL